MSHLEGKPRRQGKTNPSWEALESRQLLTGGAGSIFAILPGEINAPEGRADISTTLDPANFSAPSGRLVLGIEGEVLESTAGECIGTLCVDASRDFYIGGRIGAVVAPRVLVYGKVGYSNARVDVTDTNVDDHTNLDGIRAGAGVEWQFRNSPLSIRAEYRYTNYELGVERHQGTLGLAFRF